MTEVIKIESAEVMWEKATQIRETMWIENEFAVMMENFKESIESSASCGGYHIYIEIMKNTYNFFEDNIDTAIEMLEEANYIVDWKPSPRAKHKLGTLYICWGEEE